MTDFLDMVCKVIKWFLIISLVITVICFVVPFILIISVALIAGPNGKQAAESFTGVQVDLSKNKFIEDVEKDVNKIKRMFK